MKSRDEPLNPLGAIGTFGYVSGANDWYSTIENRVCGSPATPSSNGTVNNITAYLRTDRATNIKCALYNNATNAFVATTEERSINSASLSWQVFNFTTTVNIYNNVNYLICAWSQDAGGYSDLGYTVVAQNGVKWLRQDENTYGTWADPFVQTSSGSTIYYQIYCSYTVAPTETRTNTEIFNHWWTGANESYRVATEVFNRYWLGANESYRVITQVGNYWWLGENDTTPPEITINYAGNLSDNGGPYWRPPGESTQLTGTWLNGYYTNDSKQSEDWIYINLSVSDSQSAINNVWLNWLNDTTWTNYTYAFTNTIGDYWDYNTSEIITTYPNCNYSFNIVANSTAGSNTTWWNKTATGGSYTRRYVQLNCTSTNISYIPFYLYNATYGDSDLAKKDRLHHDQGGDGTVNDTGYMNIETPDNTVQKRYCSDYIGWWFDYSVNVQTFTLNNIYYHIWWNSTDDGEIGNWVDYDGIGWYKGRSALNFTMTDRFFTNVNYTHSNITYDSKIYHLVARLNSTTSTIFTDNDLYELSIRLVDLNGYSSSVSNRSFNSFILFNVPSNETLNSTNNDNDGLNDYNELYLNFTNPFLDDTDNDGYNDYDEVNYSTDPNNYTDFPIIRNIIEVFNNWWLGSNESYRLPTQVYDYYWNGANDSYRLPTQIYNYWWLGSNQSYRETQEVFNHYWLGSNESYRQPIQLYDGYWLGGNGSYRLASQVYDYYWLGGNTTQHIPTMVYDYYWLGGNESYRLSSLVYDSYWLGGNVSRFITQLYDYYWLGENGSYRQSTQLSDYYWLGENGSYRTITQLYDYYWLGGNWTHEPTVVYNHYWLGGNESYRASTQMYNHWWTGDNITNHSMITINNVYPGNNSFMIPLQPILYATINNSKGNTMNLSWYYGPSLDDCNTLLETDTSFSNSTQSAQDFNASGRGASYYWRLMVDDGETWINETYLFTTEGYGNSFPPTNGMAIIGAFSILGILAFIRMRRRKRDED